MNIINKLYLSVLLLLTAPFISTTKEDINNVVEKKIKDQQAIQDLTTELLQESETQQTVEESSLKIYLEEQIDQELYKVFEQFFDKHDKTPFSEIVTKVVSLLKMKKATLDPEQIIKCDEIIKKLEKNKTNYVFYVWAGILIDRDLLDLMSANTRSYIKSISKQVQINALMRRLKIK